MGDNVQTEEERYPISVSGFQLLNWCREMAVMDRRLFHIRFNALSNTSKRQLGTIPGINQQQVTANFPWPAPAAAMVSSSTQAAAPGPTPSPEMAPAVK